jgi:tetratricopeptide (TPR) repeat protein
MLSTVLDFISAQLRSGTSFALFGVISLALLSLFIAFLVGLVAPRPMIVVQPFEVSDDVQKHLELSGKNAADIFLDRLNALASDGAAFHGNAYSSKAHYGSVPEMLKIPVQSSFGLELKGISVDAVLAVLDRIRYQQIPIGGDITMDKDSIAIRVRWNRKGQSESLGIEPVDRTQLEGAVDSLAEQFLEHLNPELAGRAYLQEGAHIDRAISAFAGWAFSNPGNPEPFSYLARAIEEKQAEEMDNARRQADHSDLVAIAQWARGDLEWLEPGTPSSPCIADREPISVRDRMERDYLLFTVTMSRWLGPREQGIDRADATIAFEQKNSEEAFERLSTKFPWDTNYLINLGVARERRNDIDGALRADERASWVDPFNAGAQRNIAVELLNKARREHDRIAQAHLLCYALQHDNRALHQSLNAFDALPDSLDALHRLGDDASGLKLTQIMRVLRPQDKTVQTASSIALLDAGRRDEAIDALSQAADSNQQQRDIRLLTLILQVAMRRGPAQAAALAQACSDRWKNDQNLAEAANHLRGQSRQ